MKNRISVSLNLLLIIVILVMLTSGFAAGDNPGTATDPLVTQSYVEGRLNALYSSIDERLQDIEATSGGSVSSQSFDVMPVEKGTIIHLEANSQFILRSGKATAIAGKGGGLSDLTDGHDLITGETITKNHLLLIPNTDGRGVKMTEYGWVMISGSYSLD